MWYYQEVRNFRHIGIVLFVGFFLTAQFFSRIINLLVDWLWFEKVGYFNVFATILQTKAALGIGAFLFSLLFILGSALIATGSRIQWFSQIPASVTGSKPIAFGGSVVRLAAIVIAFVLSLGVGFTAMSHWQDVLQYLNATPVGTNDPIFGNDIGFYFFTFPLLRIIQGLSLQILIPTTVITIGIYALRGKIVLKKAFADAIEQPVKTHILLLVAALVGLIAFGLYLARLQLLFSPAGIVHGIAFTDMHARLPLLTVQFWAAILLALGLLVSIVVHTRKLLIGATAIFLLATIASGVYPNLLQKFIVAPNELVKETPFIINHIEATRDAYGLDEVDTRPISTDEVLTSTDIANNETTIKNVRLWDRGPLLDTFSQIQEIRTYYDFASIDDDRYTIDGELRQVMLSPRELSPAQLPNRNFINEHLIFTHGYGLTVGPINQVTPEGLPVLFVQDIPPASEVPEIQVDQPEIYYGERTTNYVFTNTKQPEFNYPSGDDNTYTTYVGNGGVAVDSIWKKLLFAIEFGAPKIFLSNDITNNSNILINRQILDRVHTIAPFLTYDSDPYMVVIDGKLMWILDAYTTSRYYPYAQPDTLNNRRVSYARNSVKAVVDAYNGSVSFYTADTDDPIIKTFAKIFPGTFHPLAQMPEELVAHIRYPTDIFQLQAQLYQVYHMQNPNVFYNQEDTWEIPQIRPEGSELSQTTTRETIPQLNLHHLVMKLPGEETEEFVLINPFTPKSKNNLIAWLAARSDLEHYGKLVVYQFPKQKLIFGPQQVIARINQNSEISRQITLWDQRGSQVIQGPLLVIPIEKSLLYVRPLYIRAETGRIPELKRVIVAYENSIAMEQTLEQALAKVFGSGTTSAPAPAQEEVIEQIETTINQAQDHYNAALRAQRDGDWTRYGEEIKRLGEILSELSSQQ